MPLQDKLYYSLSCKGIYSQMRALDNGIKIKSVITDKDSLSINVEGDMDNV